MTTRRRPGVSLVETLVVLGLMGLLIGLLLPAVQNARGTAARLECLSNLRQLGLAMHQYESQHYAFPSNIILLPTGRGKDHIAAVSWRAPLLPYLDQNALWAKSLAAARIDKLTYHNPPHVAMTTVVRPFICPADGRLTTPIHDPERGITAAYTSYLGVMGITPTQENVSNPAQYSGVFVGILQGTTLAEITDGLSNTLAVGERPPPASWETGWWYSVNGGEPGDPGLRRGPATGLFALWFSEPQTTLGHCVGPFTYGPGRLDNPCDRYHFWSFHSGGANFVFADASARNLGYQSKSVIPALATRAGGETVQLPD